MADSVATGLSLVNIRLLPFSTSDNIRFVHYSATDAKCLYYHYLQYYLAKGDTPCWIWNRAKCRH